MTGNDTQDVVIERHLAAPVDLPREDPLVPFLQARGAHEDHVPRGDGEL